jgi:hypothetical protein
MEVIGMLNDEFWILNEEEVRAQQEEKMRVFIVAGASCCRPSLERPAPIQAVERKRRDCE